MTTASPPIVRRQGRALAAKTEEAPEQYLTFSLHGEMFAVGILNIVKVLAVEEIAMLTKVAGSDGTA